MRNLNRKRIIILTIGKPWYSRIWTYCNGARKLGAQVEFKKIDNKNLISGFGVKKSVFIKRYMRCYVANSLIY
jgi:hypothetical protein